MGQTKKKKRNERIINVISKHGEPGKLMPMFKELADVGGNSFRKAMRRMGRVLKKNGHPIAKLKAAA